MKSRNARIALGVASCALVLTAAAPARAAKVLILSNQGATSTAADFTAKTVGHTYTAMEVANAVPTLAMMNQHDAVLLFENGHFNNATAVGDAVAAYYNQGGKCVVIGTFYWQERSDNPKYFRPGWGALEAVDVFTGKAEGSEYNADSMDVNAIVPHPITQGVASLSAGAYRGGIDPKPNTTVLAKWLTPNKLGGADPLVGIRQDPNGSKFVGISVFPDYEGVGNYGVDFNGDFHKLWENTFAWCGTPCGNGMVNNGEECDDGNTMSGDGCTAMCLTEECGDGVDNNGDAEECDDGNPDNTDTCTSLCKLSTCGDGFVQAGVESCDDGNQVDDDACSNGCAPASCGDGIKQASEGCDDKNADNTDACLDTCVLAGCGDGFVQAGVEECDDGNIEDADECLGTCKAASCGDGVVQVDVEACDDGNADDGDNCVMGCKQAICGDGFVYVGIEECDDGNMEEEDECSNGCVVPGDSTTDGTGGVSAGMTTGEPETSTGEPETSTGPDPTTGATGGDSNTGGGEETGTPTTGGGGEASGAGSSSGEGSTTGEGAIDDGGGCGCRTGGGDLGGGLLALLGLGWLGRGRSRRRG